MQLHCIVLSCGLAVSRDDFRGVAGAGRTGSFRWGEAATGSGKGWASPRSPVFFTRTKMKTRSSFIDCCPHAGGLLIWQTGSESDRSPMRSNPVSARSCSRQQLKSKVGCSQHLWALQLHSKSSSKTGAGLGAGFAEESTTNFSYPASR